MNMNTLVALDTPRVSVKDLIAAGRLPKNFSCSRALKKQKLTKEERQALMDDPLTPVDRANSAVYEAQLRLLKRMKKLSSDKFLQAYCHGLLETQSATWDFLAHESTFDNSKPAPIEDAQSISIAEGRRIVALCSLWSLLQGYARPLVEPVSQLVFKSSRATHAEKPQHDAEAQLSLHVQV